MRRSAVRERGNGRVFNQGVVYFSSFRRFFIRHSGGLSSFRRKPESVAPSLRLPLPSSFRRFFIRHSGASRNLIAPSFRLPLPPSFRRKPESGCAGWTPDFAGCDAALPIPPCAAAILPGANFAIINHRQRCYTMPAHRMAAPWPCHRSAQLSIRINHRNRQYRNRPRRPRRKGIVEYVFTRRGAAAAPTTA